MLGTQLKVILLLVGLIVLYLLSSNMDYEEQKEAEAFYCNMIKLYEVTQGEQGWPPYDASYTCPYSK